MATMLTRCQSLSHSFPYAGEPGQSDRYCRPPRQHLNWSRPKSRTKSFPLHITHTVCSLCIILSISIIVNHSSSLGRTQNQIIIIAIDSVGIVINQSSSEHIPISYHIIICRVSSLSSWTHVTIPKQTPFELITQD